jgi:hypothetical protein
MKKSKTPWHIIYKGAPVEIDQPQTSCVLHEAAVKARHALVVQPYPASGQVAEKRKERLDSPGTMLGPVNKVQKNLQQGVVIGSCEVQWTGQRLGWLQSLILEESQTGWADLNRFMGVKPARTFDAILPMDARAALKIEAINPPLNHLKIGMALADVLVIKH